jgi:hypothetical protein
VRRKKKGGDPVDVTCVTKTGEAFLATGARRTHDRCKGSGLNGPKLKVKRFRRNPLGSTGHAIDSHATQMWSHWRRQQVKRMWEKRTFDACRGGQRNQRSSEQGNGRACDGEYRMEWDPGGVCVCLIACWGTPVQRRGRLPEGQERGIV